MSSTCCITRALPSKARPRIQNFNFEMQLMQLMKHIAPHLLLLSRLRHFLSIVESRSDWTAR